MPGSMRRKKVKHRVEDQTVRIGSIWAIPDLLNDLGTDPAEVLTAAGLNPTLFDDPDRLISFAARGRLFRQCVARSGCQHFGLLVGQRGGLNSLGLVGLLVKHAPDVGAAMRSLVSYYHLHAHGAVLGCTVDNDVAMLTYDIYQRNAEAVDQVGDGAIAIMMNIMRALCGPDWRPIEVWFAHRKPADVRPFRQFFHAPLRFDAERNTLVFSAHWLSLRLPVVDPELKRLLQKQIGAIEARHGEEFPDLILSVLRSALMTNQGSADQVAALFSMHSRTLNRRLGAFGTTFRALVDESRFEFARQMLEMTALDVSQIATLLNYADASGFTRAFRRWSGTTPAVWRTRRGRAVQVSRPRSYGAPDQ
jgi:AraC-like DNA-binding protein